MYTGTNVQPQMNNTGHGGSNNGESKEQAQPVSANELPAPAPVADTNAVASSPVLPPKPAAPAPTPQGDDHWVQEVEQLFDRTAQNPHQRGEEFSELRRRYQQDVLGIKHVGRDESA